MLREIEEEVDIHGSIEPRILGYINDESNPVGEVHFGVLYVIETDAEFVRPKSSEIGTGRLLTLKDVEEIRKDAKIEDWSEIALDPVRSYLENLDALNP